MNHVFGVEQQTMLNKKKRKGEKANVYHLPRIAIPKNIPESDPYLRTMK